MHLLADVGSAVYIGLFIAVACHRYVNAPFCTVCGALADVYPTSGQWTYCSEHCPSHEYKYERGDGWRCDTCGDSPPDYWYDDGDRL